MPVANYENPRSHPTFDLHPRVFSCRYATQRIAHRDARKLIGPRPESRKRVPSSTDVGEPAVRIVHCAIAGSCVIFDQPQHERQADAQFRCGRKETRPGGAQTSKSASTSPPAGFLARRCSLRAARNQLILF